MDGHVHIHRDVPDLEVILRRMSKLAPGAAPVLMLAESRGSDAYSRLRDASRRYGAEKLGMAAGMLIIPGWQVVSEEGLEVLVQGVEEFDTFGASAERIIEAAFASGAVVTLPWGFGKWIGRRRRLVRRLIDAHGSRILVGDISGRPPGWVEPIFAGRPIMRGADNLPISGSEKAIGRYGSLVECSCAGQSPAACLLEQLRSPRGSFPSFGSRYGLARALTDQLRLRLPAGAA